ncbi:MAG: Foldase protein PrsA precursor [Phycisphaerales bacterium]|nr:Foldase protein PrsA precursor [Phycisphaerales bacterium]
MVVHRAFGALFIGTALLSGCGEKPQPSSEERAPMAFASSGNGEVSPTVISRTSGRAEGSPVAPVHVSPGSADQVIARINGNPMTMEQLVRPLVESHGLTMLMNLVQLELVKQDAHEAGVKVSDQDIADERKITLDRLFKGTESESKLQGKLDDALLKNDDALAAKIRAEMDSDREAFLKQFLDNQHISPGEYDIVLQINAYIRKIALPQVEGKINDEAVQNAFGQMYGELVKVRYIEMGNMDQVTKAKIRLGAGEKFEDVARDMSINRLSAEQGGELPPFSRQSQQVPQNFKDVAFSLKPGETSDVVAYGQSFILIKQIEKIAPRAVKFEDVKESVRRTLNEKLLQTAVKKLREDLAVQALGKTKSGNPILVIEDPVLRRQFQTRQAEQIHQRDRIQEEMNREQRLRDSLKGGAATQPATQPAQGTPPATGAAPEAATAPAGERPPATRPGTVTLPGLPQLDSKPASQPQPGK